MAGNNIRGITIEIGADTQPLNRALEDVNRRFRDLQGELRQVDRLLRLDPSNIELVAQRQQLLGEAVENTTDRLETLREAERQVQQQFERGEVGAEQYRAIQREVMAAEQNLQSLQSQLTETNTRWSDMSSNLQSAGTKMKDIGGSMSAKVTTPIVKGLTLAVEGTREFREELARLETNAQMAGANVDITKEALRDLGGLSDDNGANVEALSNLLQAGFKDNTLTDVVNELSGAVIKFPDALKIEGLADGLQKTLATGEAIGPFSELLERMGVDLEGFNEGLANASKTGEEHNYVLQELSKLGLAEVNEAYRENNSTLIESAEAQNRLKEATAELADILEPILTTIKEVLAGVLEQFLALSPEMQKNIGIVVGLVAVIGPLLMLVGQMALGLSALIGFFTTTSAATVGATTATSTFGTVIAALTGPIAIAIAAIVAIGAVIVALWKTNEEFRDNVMIIWEQVKEIFNLAMIYIQELVTTIYTQIMEFWQQNSEQIQNITQAIWDIIATIFNTTLEIISGLIEVFIAVITGDWERFGNGLQSIWQSVWNGIKSIIDSAKTIIQNTVEIFINFVTGKWEGFGETLRIVWDTLWNTIQTVIDSMLTIIQGLIDTFIGIVTGNWETFTNGLKNIWSGMWDGIRVIVEGAWRLLSGAFSSLWDNISGWFSDLVDSAFDWGKNMIDGFIDGIEYMASKVASTVSSVVSTAASYIGFNSPAEKGEGRHIVEWGYNMIDGFIDGMNKAMPELQMSARSIMPAVKNEINTPISIDYGKIPKGDTTIYVNNPQSNPSELARQIKRTQQQMALGF